MATLSGVIDSHAAVSYGYGASLVWLANLFRAELSAQGRLLALAYLLYGVKVCIFQAARDVRPAYVIKALAPARAHAGFSSPAKRVPFCISIAMLLTTFAFPLHVVAVAGPSLLAAKAVTSGAALALAGLLLQTVADIQKYVHKARRGANSPCMSGLWSWSRHPNYLGEIIFHCGLLLAGLSACRSAASAWLVLLAPVTFISIMFGSTRGLEKRQLEAYGDNSNYQSYLRRTPRLFFFVRPCEASTKDTPSRATASAPTASSFLLPRVPSSEPPPEAAVSDAISEEEIARIMNADYPDPE